MDLRQLEYVVAVVDHGTFTRAAEAVHVAQPSLSQAVRALEAELGVELFHRTPRGATPTVAGEALVGPARQALRDVAVARAAVADVVGLVAGRLDIVTLPTLAVVPAADLVGRFRRAHPGVSVRLVEPEDAAAIAELVRTGASELGITVLPAADDLVAHPLAEQTYVALLPASLADDVPPARVSLAQLADEPMVTTPTGTSTRRLVEEAFADAGLAVNVAVETDHREAIAPLVQGGAGVAIVPRDAVPWASVAAAKAAGVIVRDLRPHLTRDIGIVHRSGPQSPAAHAFLGLAVGAPGRRPRPAPRRRSGGRARGRTGESSD